MVLSLILLCFAFLMAGFAAFKWDSLGPVHTGWLAVALLILSMLLRGVVL